MNYDQNSSIVGFVPIRSGWRSLLTQHGAVPDADSIIGSYHGWCIRYHLDPNLALAQACLEAAYFTSQRWTQENNPAGLGVTADNTPPNPFKTTDEGIQAHCEHLCAYCYTIAECPVDHGHMADRRHMFHLGRPTVAGLEMGPKWAVPGDVYCQHIVDIANSVPEGANPVPTPTPQPTPDPSAEDFPTEVEMGFPVRLEATDFVGADRSLDQIDWNVVHDTEGHFAGDIAVLTHGSRNGSVHAIIGREPGQFVVSVPIRTTAWTAGNDALGARAIQVELSKATDETGYTDWQYTALAAFYRWCEAQGVTVPRVYLGLHPADADNGPLLDERGYIGHAGVPDGAGGWGGFAHHVDPIGFDWSRFIGLLGDAPPPPQNLVDGHDIGTGFFQLYRSVSEDTAARARIFGLCISDQRDTYLIYPATAAQKKKGLNVVAHPVVQVDFERVRMIYDKGRTPDPFSVRIPQQHERLCEPDDVYVIAVLHSMELANEPI